MAHTTVKFPDFIRFRAPAGSWTAVNDRRRQWAVIAKHLGMPVGEDREDVYREIFRLGLECLDEHLKDTADLLSAAQQANQPAVVNSGGDREGDQVGRVGGLRSNYGRQQFDAYLDQLVSTSKCTNGLIGHVRTFWQQALTVDPRFPVPSGGPLLIGEAVDIDGFILVWDAQKHHVDVDIFADGRFEWFYFNRETEESVRGKDRRCSQIPDDLRQHLLAIISGVIHDEKAAKIMNDLECRQVRSHTKSSPG